MEAQAISIKIVAVGDGIVGKTCILTTYVNDAFPTEYIPTVFDSCTKSIKCDSKSINLSLWDTAGQEAYAKLRPLSYNNCDIFLIIFSVVEPDTFINAVKKWYPEVHQANPQALIVFVGNKIDLRNAAEMHLTTKYVTKEVVIKTIQEFKCQYYECSALTRVGLGQLFQSTIRLFLNGQIPSPVPKQGQTAQKSHFRTDSCCRIM